MSGKSDVRRRPGAAEVRVKSDSQTTVVNKRKNPLDATTVILAFVLLIILSFLSILDTSTLVVILLVCIVLVGGMFIYLNMYYEKPVQHWRNQK